MVLEIGCGNNPSPEADVWVDLYPWDNLHRSHLDDLTILDRNRFICADLQHLPFKDKQFDKILCRHVIEHVPSPTQACREMQRVARCGEMEFPSLGTELFMSVRDPDRWNETHKWFVVVDGDNVVHFLDKKVGVLPIPFDSIPIVQFKPAENMTFGWRDGFSCQEWIRVDQVGGKESETEFLRAGTQRGDLATGDAGQHQSGCG